MTGLLRLATLACVVCALLGVAFPLSWFQRDRAVVLVDHSYSMPHLEPRSKNRDIYYFSSGVGTIDNTGSRNATDVEFALKWAKDQGITRLAVLSDFNQTIGDALSWAQSQNEFVVDTVLAQKQAAPGITTIQVPEYFVPGVPVDCRVGIQHAIGGTSLRVTGNQQSLYRSPLNAQSPSEIIIPLTLTGTENVSVNISLEVQGVVLDEFEVLIKPAKRQSVMVVGKEASLSPIFFSHTRFEPTYAPAPLGLAEVGRVVMMDPDLTKMSSNDWKRLTKHIREGVQVIWSIGPNYVMLHNELQKMIPWLPMDLTTPGVENRRLVVLCDASGSMAKLTESKTSRIQSALTTVVDILPRVQYKTVDMWTFNTDATILPKKISTDVLQAVQAKGGTDLLASLKTLIKHYEKESGEVDVVVLSDGFSKGGHFPIPPKWRINTVAIGEKANGPLLKQIANDHRGQYFNAVNWSKLASALEGAVNQSRGKPIPLNNPKVNDDRLMAWAESKDLHKHSFIPGQLRAQSRALIEQKKREIVVATRSVGAGLVDMVSLQGKQDAGALGPLLLSLLNMRQLQDKKAGQAERISIKRSGHQATIRLNFPGTVTVKGEPLGLKDAQLGKEGVIGLAAKGAYPIRVYDGKALVDSFILYANIDAESAYSKGNHSLAAQLAAVTRGEFFQDLRSWEQSNVKVSSTQSDDVHAYAILALLFTLLLYIRRYSQYRHLRKG